MIYIAFTLFLISLAICGWFTFAFLAWSGPSEAEVDSYLAPAVIERVHVRATGDVQ